MNDTFIPVVAKSGKHLRKGFHHEVKLNYLPEKPMQELPGGEFHLEVEFHFLNQTTGDIDNLLKPTLDVLKGSLIRDDRQIKSIQAVLKEYSNKQGVQIRLTPLNLKDAIHYDRLEATAEIQVKPRKRKKKKKVEEVGWPQRTLEAMKVARLFGYKTLPKRRR